mmetsp:Transcript_114881/g.199860  ORF Transcript_114881/g.199860 Transcript_114881/m.199860 type:complete len:100 (-) Transcript_114881:511-810(-)
MQCRLLGPTLPSIDIPLPFAPGHVLYPHPFTSSGPLLPPFAPTLLCGPTTQKRHTRKAGPHFPELAELKLDHPNCGVQSPSTKHSYTYNPNQPKGTTTC